EDCPGVGDGLADGAEVFLFVDFAGDFFFGFGVSSSSMTTFLPGTGVAFGGWVAALGAGVRLAVSSRPTACSTYVAGFCRAVSMAAASAGRGSYSSRLPMAPAASVSPLKNS